jgi:hypothetical protein
VLRKSLTGGSLLFIVAMIMNKSDRASVPLARDVRWARQPGNDRD